MRGGAWESQSVGATGFGGVEGADWVDGDEPVDRRGGLPHVGEHVPQLGKRGRRSDEVRPVGRPSRAILADDDRLPAELECPLAHPRRGRGVGDNDRPVGPQPAEHRSQEERRQMDTVGDEGHKRQLLAGEHPMEDVVVTGKKMRAAVAEMGETGEPRGAAFTEELERRIAVAGRDEHASAGEERDRAKGWIALRGERHHPHMPPPRVEEPLHRCWSGFAGMLRRMGADEAARRLLGARGFALGVQWHPEYDWERDADSRAIFEAFGRAAAAHAGTKLAAAAE